MSKQPKMCSFCAARPAAFSHHIDTRNVAPWEDEPIKEYLACISCHSLIANDDYAVLVQRIARSRPDLRNKLEDERTTIATQMVDGFLNLDAGIYEQLGFE